MTLLIKDGNDTQVIPGVIWYSAWITNDYGWELEYKEPVTLNGEVIGINKHTVVRREIPTVEILPE